MAPKIRICRNPKCHGDIWTNERAPLGICASCQWIAKWALAAGAFLAGAVIAFGKWKGWWV